MAFLNRIEIAMELTRARKLDAVILFHSRDLLYYTGTAQPAWLVILPDDYLLFIRNGFEFATRESWLPPEKIIPERNFEAIGQRLFPAGGWGRKVGTELDLMVVPQAAKWDKALCGVRLEDFSEEILGQRMIKCTEEVELIKQACLAAHEGHLAAMRVLQPGLTELEMSAAIENGQRLAGHEGVFFMRQPDFFMGRGPLASGENIQEISGVIFSISGKGLSPAAPAGASRRVIREGDLILVDIPPCVHGYHADQSRMYCAGSPTEKAVYWADCLKNLADDLLNYIRPGMSCEEVYSLALNRAAILGLEDYFMRFPSGSRAHFIGHGLGLDLNEPPLLGKGHGDILQAGVILTLELHLMPSDDMTVKLEDTFHLTPHGPELLTISPRELNVV